MTDMNQREKATEAAHSSLDRLRDEYNFAQARCSRLSADVDELATKRRALMAELHQMTQTLDVLIKAHIEAETRVEDLFQKVRLWQEE